MGRPLRLRHRPICWLTRNSGSSKQSARPIPARGIRGARIAVHGEHPRSAAVSLVPHPRFATPAGGQLRQWQHRGVALGADGVPQELTSVFDSYGAGPRLRQKGPHAHHILHGPDGTYWGSILARMWFDAFR
jgi:hypothetical protein